MLTPLLNLLLIHLWRWIRSLKFANLCILRDRLWLQSNLFLFWSILCLLSFLRFFNSFALTNKACTIPYTRFFSISFLELILRLQVLLWLCLTKLLLLLLSLHWFLLYWFWWLLWHQRLFYARFLEFDWLWPNNFYAFNRLFFLLFSSSNSGLFGSLVLIFLLFRFLFNFLGCLLLHRVYAVVKYSIFKKRKFKYFLSFLWHFLDFFRAVRFFIITWYIICISWDLTFECWFFWLLCSLPTDKFLLECLELSSGTSFIFLDNFKLTFKLSHRHLHARFIV